MDNSLHVFNNSDFGEIGVLIEKGKEWFPATECARLLGYSNPHDAVARHCKGLVKREVLTDGGKQEINFIPEADLFRLIVKSKLPQAEKFEAWVFEEVLPTIRKHGIYAADTVIDRILSDPEYGIKLLTELKAEREKRKELEVENAKNKQRISELQPKASYYDLILQNKTLMTITQIAKDYGMSAKAFNKLLHDLGIQYKLHDTWLLYQGYADKGYTQSKTHSIDENRSVMHTYWTQKGRLFIYDLLKNKKGILPVIEHFSDKAM